MMSVYYVQVPTGSTSLAYLNLEKIESILDTQTEKGCEVRMESGTVHWVRLTGLQMFDYMRKSMEGAA